MSETEKRMAGDYEIVNSIHIGNKEVVLGIHKDHNCDGRYYCGYCDTNEILELYVDGAVSNNYPAIVKLFGERIVDEAKEVIKQIELEKEIVGDDKELTKSDCTPITYEDNIVDKVVVIDGNILRPEYQRASHQLAYVTGGNGAYANARGRKVFTKSLLNGQENTFYRQDIMGIVDVEKLPKWAKDGYENIIKPKDRGER